MKFFQDPQNLLLIAVALVSGAMLLWPLVRRGTGGPWVSTLEATMLINQKDALVLDVREPGEFAQGHILNALNVPQTKLGERIGELGKDTARPIVVYCALGGVAAQASHTLKKAGYAEVYPIRGGLNGWLSASLPVTTR